jgi:hypothetical protein
MQDARAVGRADNVNYGASIMSRPGRSYAPSILSILAAFSADAAMAQTPLPPSAADRPAPSSAAQPGVQRALIKPDTPAERDAFLKRREANRQRADITTVAPLPAQTISPNATERQKAGPR